MPLPLTRLFKDSMRHFIVFMAAITAAIPSLAAAFEPGVYLGVDAARASVSSRYVDDSNDVSIGGRIGYQYTPSFGFDVYARGLSLNPLRGLFTEAGYYPDRHYGVAVQGTVPLAESISVYGRAGIGRTTLKSTRSSIGDKDETDGMAGLGVSYHFNRQWSLNLEASYLTKSEVKLLSIGSRLQF